MYKNLKSIIIIIINTILNRLAIGGWLSGNNPVAIISIKETASCVLWNGRMLMVMHPNNSLFKYEETLLL
jgi:hypothetical protein